MNYDGAINEIPRQDNTTNILAYTPVNFDKTVDFGFDFLFDIDITNDWNIYFATSFYNITEETSFGNDFIDLSRWSNYTEMANNMTLLEDNSLNLNLSLAWVGKNLYALQTIEDRLVTGLSLTKSILNKKGVISLSFEDLFNFQDEKRSVRYLNQSSRQNIDVDNRFVKLGFRYKFGNTGLSTNERTTDAEERDRIKDLQ